MTESNKLSHPVTVLPGVGSQRARTLNGMGIHTVADLLFFFPRDYDDRSEIKTVAMLSHDATNTIRGEVYGFENVSFASKKNAKPLIMTKAKLKDDTGELELVWFNQPYLKQYFKPGRIYMFTGRVRLNYNRVQMESPEYVCCPAETAPASSSVSGIVPVYSTVKSIPQKLMRSLVSLALKHCGEAFAEDRVPSAVRERYCLVSFDTAVRQIHFPDSDAAFLAARGRLVFEELFFMQLALFRIKGTVSEEPGAVIPPVSEPSPLSALLPFSFTSSQSKVLDEIKTDLKTGRRMNRLIQGDVGSGKTAVAMAVSYEVINGGYQAAIMAPTEVLAEQHYESFSKYFSPLGIRTVLLTGSVKARERREALTAIADGGAQMIVGTHALIQQKVVYFKLALVITDEQHRFGVNQRLALSLKGTAPHTLVMTATPIPRTLGLILYGDMDISIIDGMPPGRIEIKTYCVNGGYRARLHAFIKRETDAGRQAYVICPAIEESDAEIKDVLRYTEQLKKSLPSLSISALHGKMKPQMKNEIMTAFKAGEIKVIVSTTVIEVGVHADNATLMIIENAERFGLSQLHQLRGRVGRGNHQSYCVLVTDVNNEQTKKRMKAMTDTSDGFKLSEMDLELRGAGDFFGTRQHGLPVLRIANLYRDMDVLKKAQAAAEEVNRKADIGEAAVKITPNELELIKKATENVLDEAGKAGIL